MDRLTQPDERLATFARRARAVVAVALVLLAFGGGGQPPGAPPRVVTIGVIVGQLLALNLWSTWAIPADVDPREIANWFPLLFSIPILAAFVGWSVDTARAAEDRMMTAQAALERSNRALAGFANTVAHDLRSPLAAAAGTAEIVRDRKADLTDEQLRQLVDTLARSARQASDLVTDMLDVADGRRQSSTLVVSDLRAWLLALLGPVIAERHGSLDVTGHSRVVDVPVTAIQTVVLNLVTNALKHTRPDVPPQVRVTVAEPDDPVLFLVDDNGPGIPVEERQYVLERGTRGRYAAEQGTGHGLTEVTRIVREELGGALTITDSPLGGARLEVHTQT